jgi:hypothetical protein
MAAGALMKLFPLLIAPALISAAIRTRTVRELSWGVCAGVAPAAVLLLAWPWWRFADLHASRGLQVESLAASVLWLGRHLWSWDVQWVGAAASYEIAGDPAALVLTWARVPWILSLAASAAVAAWSVRGHEARSAPALARAALLPVLAFVAFSPVISPQFMIWLQLLAAMVLLDRPRLAAGVILLAAAVTPLVYPSESYRHGLDVIRTVILLARNLALVLGWGLLMREALRREQSDEISGGDGRDAVTR